MVLIRQCTVGACYVPAHRLCAWATSVVTCVLDSSCQSCVSPVTSTGSYNRAQPAFGSRLTPTA